MSELPAPVRSADIELPNHPMLGWAGRAGLIVGTLSCLVIIALNLTGMSAPAAVQKADAVEKRGFLYHASHERSIPADVDRQFFVEISFQDQHARFLVDETVPTVLLSPEDAAAAGVDLKGLVYSSTVTTPEGQVHAAPVMIKMLTMKEVTFFNLEAAVADHALPTSILGASFLDRFADHEIKDGDLVLRW
jgi:clan AA aspartic protease (TIGR02281 family)